MCYVRLSFTGIGFALQISAWLHALGLGRYEDLFVEHEIDWEVLPDLTDGDLEKIGLPLGPRKKLLKAIAAADDSITPATAATAAPAEQERRQLTVMFVDLVSSTELSAGLDPEDMSDVIRRYQNAVAGEITRFEGHLAKYMGDGVLAYFGWPTAHEDDSERAVRAALSISGAVKALTTPTGQPLEARIGIATGQVVVGDLLGGAEERAVVGDTPNLAARLQNLARPGGIVIAQSTRRLLGGLFEVADLGPQQLKGFADPLRAFEVEGESRVEGRFEAMHGHRVTPLVGREHELGLLLNRFERAREGEGQVVVLSGEAGIGKSRMLRALRERLSQADYMALSHYCSPYHTNSAFYPIIELLERAAGFEHDDTPAAKLAKLETLLALGTERPDVSVPLVADLLEVPLDGRYKTPDLTPQRLKERTLDVLIDQVVGLAARQPVLAVYEDVQWVDPTTLEAIGLVIERVRNLSVLVVVTTRPEFNSPWQGHAHVMQLSLTRLTCAQGSDIVEQVTGGKSVPPEVLDQILARADGVPLFVEELTKTVLEMGLLQEGVASYELSGPLPPLAIPSSLRDSLMARLDRLAPVKEVAQIAAVIGRDFSHRVLAAVSSLPEEHLCSALDQLAESELIFRRGKPPDAVYSFKHALVQDAAYQTLLRSRRQQNHARIADVLRRRFPDIEESKPEVLAHHFTEAGLTAEAIICWQKAGQRAMARSATAEAVAHLSKGLDLVAVLPDSPERQRHELALQLALASAYVAAHGVSAPKVGTAYARARELCDQLGDVPQWFAIRYGQCIFHLYRAELAEARESAEDLNRATERHDNTDLRFFALRATGVAALPRGDFREARDHLERALALYDHERHRVSAAVYAFDPQVVCLDYLSRALVPLGNLDRAVAMHDQALAEARQRRHHNTLALPLFFGAMIHQMLGDIATMSERTSELVLVARDQGLRLWAAGASVLSGWLAAREGQSEDGLAGMRSGIESWRSTGAEIFVPYFLQLMAEAHSLAGEMERSIELLDQAIERVERTGERWLEAEHFRQKAEVVLRCEQPDVAKAEACFAHALSVARQQHARFWELRAACGLAGLMHQEGRDEEALGILEAAWDFEDDGSDVADVVAARSLLATLERTCSSIGSRLA